MSGITIVTSEGGVPTSAPFQGEIPGGDPSFLPFPTEGTPTQVFPSDGASSQSVPSVSPSPSSTPAGSSTSSTGSSSSSSSTAGSSTSSTGSSSTSLSAASDTKTFSSSTSILPSTSTSTTKLTSHNKNVIIGGVTGGVVGLLIITAFLMYYLIRRSRLGKITAFKVSPDTSVEPTSEARLQAGPHPPQPPLATPDISTTNPSSVSGSSMPADSQHMFDKTANHESSPAIAIFQRDSLTDQSMSHPNRSSPELVRSTLPLPIISHNQRSLDPLLREIMNATQGRNQGSLDPGNPNVPQNVQIFIINQNRDGENGENRGVGYYGRSSPRNMDIDTLSLPPGYE